MTKTPKTEKYIEGIGRRKTSVARVRITPNSKTTFIINDKSMEEYFKTDSQKKIVREAIEIFENKKNFNISVCLNGGGLSSQAESLRLGLSRALVKLEEENRKTLKKAGFLKRDPRSKERRKFGLKKARKAAQWSKR